MIIGLTDFDGSPAPLVDFVIGTIVCHKLYGYRGVVVAFDSQCMAGDTWYYANQTQPSKDQPWYHVLVHESGGLSTYAAQSNLILDESGAEVHHPRIDSYFSELKDGRYIVHTSDSGSCSC